MPSGLVNESAPVLRSRTTFSAEDFAVTAASVFLTSTWTFSGLRMTVGVTNGVFVLFAGVCGVVLRVLLRKGGEAK